ncbi:NLP effector protein 10 [Paramyrothecium foliicola]|nr:NLP effector protein 10 [Paramyrothecium foliicola]
MNSFVKSVAFLSALAQVQGAPTTPAKRDVISALPGSASDLENKFQPLLDFDSDGCYNTAAIDPSGNTNPGKDATGTPEGQCRDPPQLENSNAYSRARCNNGFCAIMYEYYFEKDQAVLGSFLGGHKHDWENIVVFTQGETVVRVAPSCHGGYGDASNQFPINGQRPYIVYHKDGAGTHCFRFANDGDISSPENPFGEFYTSPLIGWDSWPDVGLRDKMLSAWSGGVGPKLDNEFGDKLKEAAGDGVAGFDPYLDA